MNGVPPASRNDDRMIPREPPRVRRSPTGTFAIISCLLLGLVGRRISDRRILQLLRQWLTAGIVEEGR